MIIAREIADRIHALRFEDIGPEALEWTRHAFTDTIGCALAGMMDQGPRILMSVPGVAEAPGPALIYATNTRTSVLDAALVNGTASHALDYDDVAASMGGHPSAVLVAPLIALGEQTGASGRDLALAYVVGFETECRIGRGVHFHHYEKGWHPTATLGIFGTVAAAARLLHLTPDITAVALGMAASFASGLKANFGTMTKPLHAGRAAAAGIEAVRLSQLGLTSAPDVFEHAAGYLSALSPAGRADRERPCELGRTVRILESGLSVKAYPVCYSGHRVIDGVVGIAERENILPTQVRRVRVTLGPAQASMLRNHRPRTGLEAKFSAEFAIAAALVERKVGLSQLTDSFVAREDVRGLLDKVVIDITHRPDPLDPAFSYADRVVIELQDGRSFDSGDIRFARGSAKLPLEAAALRRKFLDCMATGAVPAFQGPGADTALYERIAQLEALPSLRQFFG